MGLVKNRRQSDAITVIPDTFTLLAVVTVLSMVQAFFGMGLLIFGTPTLLLLGYDFTTTLSYLLPASFAISLLQVLTAGVNRVPVSRYLTLLCLPGIGAGLLVAMSSPPGSWTNMLIGGTLLVSALVRFWPPSRRLFGIMLERHLASYHLAMGIVHGLTNLGGAFLAILASETNTQKEAIRYTVAHYYLAFSVIQMLLLATVMGQHTVLVANLPVAALSAGVYLLVGNHIFARASEPSYNLSLTVFIAVYGVVVLLNF